MVDFNSLFDQAPDQPQVKKSSLDSLFDQVSDGFTAKSTESTPIKFKDVIPKGQVLGVQKQDVIKPDISFAPASKWKIGLDYSQSKDNVANTTDEIIAAAGSRFDRSLAAMFNQLDFVQTSLGDAMNQILLGRKAAVGIQEIRNKKNVVISPASEMGMPDLNTIRPFRAISDALNWAAGYGKELPNTIGGAIVGGLADIGPQILATYVAPEIAAGKIMGKLGIDYFSKFGLVMGTQGLVQSTQENQTAGTFQKLTTPIIKGIEQYATGVVYDKIVERSSKVGGRLAEKFIPEFKGGVINVATKTERIDSPFSHPDIKLNKEQAVNKMLVNSLGTTAFNANLIGGYGTLVEFLENGDTSWKTYATGVGMGIAMSGKQVGKLIYAKSINSFISADINMIQNSIDSPVGAEELINLAQSKFKSIEDGTSKNPEGDAAAGLLATRAAVLRGIIEEIQINPTDVLKTIEESTMPPEIKTMLTENVNDIVANSDKAVVESKPINDQIKVIDDQIDMIKKNSNLAPTDQEIKTKSLAAKREGLVNKVIDIHAKYAKIKTPAEEKAAQTKLAEDTKQANIIQAKAAVVFPKFNEQGIALANALDGRFESRLKSPESIVGKTTRKGSEVSTVEDVIGGALILPDMKNFKVAARRIKEMFPDAKFSNKRMPNKETGWRGVTATMTIDGIKTEIQLHTDDTWKVHQEALKLTNQYRGGIPVEVSTSKDLGNDVINPSLQGLTGNQISRIRVEKTDNGVKFRDPTQEESTEITNPKEARIIKNKASIDLEKIKAEIQKRDEAKKSDAPFKILGNTYNTREEFLQGLRDTFGGKNFDTEVLMSDDLKFDKSVKIPDIMKIIDEVSPKNPDNRSVFIEVRSSSELKILPPFYEARQKIADNVSRFLGFGKYSAEDQVKVHNENGESTFALNGANLFGIKGKASVSVFPDRTEIVDGEVTPEVLNKFIEKNKDILDGNETKLAIGTWKNNGGKTELDIVATPSRERAIELGKKYNQKTVFDLENGVDILTGGTGGGEEFKKIPIDERIAEVTATPYDVNMEKARQLYDEAYAGLENIDLEGSPALTSAQRKAKDLGLPMEQQRELSKAWTETKNKVIGELKEKNAETKQAFKDFLKAMPRLSRLNIKLQARMLNKVNNIDFTKPASLNSAIEYFDRIINNATFRYDEAKAEQALNVFDIKTSEASLTKKVANQPPKNIKGPTGLPLWDEIKAIRNDAVNKSWVEGQEKIQVIYDRLEEENRLPTVEEMNQITRLNFWGMLNSTNGADSKMLQGATRDLLSIRKWGTSEAAARKMIMKAQDTETRQEQMNVLTGGGKKPIKENREAQNDKDSFEKQVRGVFDWPMSSSYFSHLDFLSQHDKTSAPGESMLEKSLGEPFWDANLRMADQRKSLFNEMNDKFSEIWGVPKGNKLHKLSKDHTETIYDIKYKDVAGKEKNLPVTMNQAIKVYMELQDPTLERSHEAGYYKRGGELTSLGQGVFDILTPEAKAWGDWQLNEFYPKMYEIFNPVYRELYGRDMPYNSIFSPIFVEGADSKSVTADDLLSKQSFVSQLKNGSLLSRVKHERPLRLMDADQVLMSYIHNMTYWATHSEPIQLLNSFVRDPNIRSAIKQNFTNGDLHLRYLQKTVDDLMRKPSDAWMTSHWLRKLRNNILIASLAAKVPLGINQVASSLAFADYIPAAELPKYSIQSLTQWLGDKGNIALAKKIWNTTYIQQRYGQGWDNVLTEIMGSDYHSVGEKGGLHEWRNKLMSPLMGGDFTAILLGGIPVYRYTYDQAMKKYGPGSGRLAEAEAMRVVTRAADDTQQSGLWFNLSQAQTSNEFYKSMTMYKSANMQYQRKVSEGVRGLIHGRGTWQQNIKTVALYHVVLPMIYQYFANGFKWNTEEEVQAGILGNLNNLFAAGDVIEGIVNTVQGEPWKKYRVSPVMSIVDDTYSAIEHLMKVKTTEAQVTKNVPEDMIPAILAQAEKMNIYDMNYVELGKVLKYGSKVLGSALGWPIPGVTAMEQGIYDVASGKETGDTKDKVLRILGKPAYKGKDAVDNSDMTPEEVEKLLEQTTPKKKESLKPVKPKKIPNF